MTLDVFISRSAARDSEETISSFERFSSRLIIILVAVFSVSLPEEKPKLSQNQCRSSSRFFMGGFVEVFQDNLLNHQNSICESLVYIFYLFL